MDVDATSHARDCSIGRWGKCTEISGSARFRLEGRSEQGRLASGLRWRTGLHLTVLSRLLYQVEGPSQGPVGRYRPRGEHRRDAVPDSVTCGTSRHRRRQDPPLRPLDRGELLLAVVVELPAG